MNIVSSHARGSGGFFFTFVLYSSRVGVSNGAMGGEEISMSDYVGYIASVSIELVAFSISRIDGVRAVCDRKPGGSLTSRHYAFDLP